MRSWLARPPAALVTRLGKAALGCVGPSRACTHIHTYIHTRAHTHTHARARTRARTHKHTHTRTRTHARTHARTRARARAHHTASRMHELFSTAYKSCGAERWNPSARAYTRVSARPFPGSIRLQACLCDAKHARRWRSSAQPAEWSGAPHARIRGRESLRPCQAAMPRTAPPWHSRPLLRQQRCCAQLSPATLASLPPAALAAALLNRAGERWWEHGVLGSRQ
jgi:hypothetical protein